jgi:hypothetical protein
MSLRPASTKTVQFRIALAFKPLQKSVCLRKRQHPTNLLRRYLCSRLRVRPLSLGEIGVAVPPLDPVDHLLGKAKLSPVSSWVTLVRIFRLYQSLAEQRPRFRPFPRAGAFPHAGAKRGAAHRLSALTLDHERI